jgi:hypothetical protein
MWTSDFKTNNQKTTMDCFDDSACLPLANSSVSFQIGLPNKKARLPFSGPSFRVIKTIPKDILFSLSVVEGESGRSITGFYKFRDRCSPRVHAKSVSQLLPAPGTAQDLPANRRRVPLHGLCETAA